MMNADEIVKALREDVPCTDACYFAQKCVRGQECLTDAAADLIETLAAQLSASQARERAAVEKLFHIADEHHQACELCIHADGIVCDNRDECYRHSKWKWRGPQAGKGENDG